MISVINEEIGELIESFSMLRDKMTDQSITQQTKVVDVM